MPRKRTKKKPLLVFVIWALIESRQRKLSKSMAGTRVLRSMNFWEEYSEFERSLVYKYSTESGRNHRGHS